MQIKLRTTQKNIIDTGEYFNPNLEIEITSREVAKLTGKQHRNVIRDIGKIYQNSDLSSDYIIKLSSYISGTGKEYKQYVLNKEAILLLVTGYDTRLRACVISRLKELETNRFNGMASSMSLLERKIVANGSDWGKMGNDQKEARRDYKYIDDEFKKMIQPDLPLEDI